MLTMRKVKTDAQVRTRLIYSLLAKITEVDYDIDVENEREIVTRLVDMIKKLMGHGAVELDITIYVARMRRGAVWDKFGWKELNLESFTPRQAKKYKAELKVILEYRCIYGTIEELEELLRRYE